ncbi:hypothetical protein [Actinoplanes sp. GCM10030250]|uniref:hypothetical protein n=1 Tax=Actinoplanes sp. GCM10030250 TaxID=3273376 RepID=UPI00360D97DD
MPGGFAGASSRVVAEAKFTPEVLAKVFGPNGCTAEGSGPFTMDRLKMTGRWGTWVCGYGARWRYTYVWPADHRYLVALQIKMVRAEDEAVWEHMLSSLTLHGHW